MNQVSRKSGVGSRPHYLLVGGLLTLAGCVGDSGGLDYDPIRGGRPIPENAAITTGARGAAPSTIAENGDPMLPPPESAPSTAALTQGAVGVGRGPQPVADPSVKLAGPRAINGTSRMPGPVLTGTILPTSALTNPPATQPGTYEQLQQALLARGVTFQMLKTGLARDEWIFQCSVALPGKSNMEQEFHTRAVGPGGLAAMRAAIDEIDKAAAGQ
jgi:hypothetical protein